MFLRSMLLVWFSTFFISSAIFAEGLASKEAINYYNEGVKAQQNGDFDAAVKGYQMAALLSARYHKFIINNKGAMYAQMGDIQKAEAAFREALTLDPDYQPAKMNLGLIYDAKGDRLKALEWWYEAFEVEKRKPKTFLIEAPQQVEVEESVSPSY
ncbi:MAG: tetratricopeptide repeat protein [Candidatus Omnitrophota bacterium]